MTVPASVKILKASRHLTQPHDIRRSTRIRRADIQMTRQLVDIAAPLGVVIHDHIIVSRGASVSFKGLQLI